MSENVLAPRSEFQRNFLASDARIIIAGGAMGSGKSHIGLMRHLRWVEDPNYRGFCIRKNSTAIMQSGGLFESAVSLYRQYSPDIKIRTRDKQIVFPSGATISFDHYEDDRADDNYQGIEISNAMYDEAAHAKERHIWWLISRLRRRDTSNNSIWLTCNPDPDSYLFKWVEWWLFPEGHPNHGMPDPSKNGKRRYLLRKGDELYWGDTEEEVILKYGNPSLPIDHPMQVKPLSVEAHLGNIYDNPVLIAARPEYLANLEALPEIEKQRNLYGSWTARPEGAGYWRRAWVEELTHYVRERGTKTVRSFDFAGSLKSDLYPYPDYTASVRMNKSPDGEYIIDDIRRTRIRYGDWEQFVLDCARHDPPNTEYLIPVDPNPMAARATDEFVKRLRQKHRLTVRKMKTNGSKLDRFRPFSSATQNGQVKVLKDCGIDFENDISNSNDFFYKELEQFDGNKRNGENGKDDLVDSCSDAFYILASERTSFTGLGGGLKEMGRTIGV